MPSGPVEDRHVEILERQVVRRLRLQIVDVDRDFLGAELARRGDERKLEIKALLLFFVIDLAESALDGHVAGLDRVRGHERQGAEQDGREDGAQRP